MGVLKLTSSSETKKLDLGDAEFLEVRSEFSRKEFREFLGGLPDIEEGKDLSFGEADDFASSLFKLLVVSWSLEAPVDLESYGALTTDAANVVDKALTDHFKTLTPSQEEQSKSKGSSK